MRHYYLDWIFEILNEVWTLLDVDFRKVDATASTWLNFVSISATTWGESLLYKAGIAALYKAD